MLDRGDMAILLMFDLSAAFDTIDHSIMLQRLQQMFGVVGEALDWIRSHLTRRTQRVDVKGAKSEPKVLTYALPQASVLGPQGYPLYSKLIRNIVRAHGLEYHCYADDSQIYIVIKRSTITDTISRVEACVSDIQQWMEKNLLKLKEEKTEVLLISSKRKQHLLKDITLTFGDSIIEPSSKVKNLGCWWENTFSMETQVNSVVKSCCFQLRKVRRIKHYLSQDALKSLVQSLVIS